MDRPVINKNIREPVMAPYEEFPRIRDYFGRVPTVPGESPVSYLEFRRRLDEELKPVGPIQDIFVETLARAYWDYIRYSTLKADFLSSSSTDGVERLLRAMMPEQESVELLRNYRLRDDEAIAKVQQMIASLGVNSQQIAAQAFVENISVVQKIESLISIKDKAWQRAHKNLEQHKELLARRFRAVAGIKESEHFRGLPRGRRA